MAVCIGILKFLLLTGVFGAVKFLSVFYLAIPISSVSVLLEAVLVFALAFVFVFVFDLTNRRLPDKLLCAAEVSGAYIVIFVIAGILKNVFNVLTFSVIVNFVLIGLLGALCLCRDKLLYDSRPARCLTFDVLLVVYCVVMKFILNVIAYLAAASSADTGLLSYILITVFVFGAFALKSAVFNKALTGFIEFDGKEYPVFDVFRVGKAQTSDIVLDEKGAKGTTFSVNVTPKGWVVKSSSEVYAEGTLIDKSAPLESGDTIAYSGNYFTVTTAKGNLLKRMLVFFFMMISALCLSAQTGENNSANPTDMIEIDSLDFSDYPTICVYFTDNEIQKKLAGGYAFSRKDFFITEDELTPAEWKEVTDTDRPLDLVLVLDITGTLQDTYTGLRQKFADTAGNIARKRAPFRVGLITFADLPEESIFVDLTSDYDYIINRLVTTPAQSGGDYEENPYDALMRVPDMTFRTNAQKAVILVTDAPPHVRGDKGNKGRDFTNYTTDDLEKFFAASPYCLYVVSYSRFAEYGRLVGDARDFYDLSIYESHEEILRDLENAISAQLRLSYTAKRSKTFYTRANNGAKQRVVIYKDSEAHKAKNFFNQKKIKKNAFLHSLFDAF